MFEIGEKVICVNNKPWKPNWDPPSGIEEGVVYTIKGFGSWDIEGAPVTIVYLYEVQNPGEEYIFEAESLGYTLEDLEDIGYVAGRFRKLIKKKQSIEIFQQIRKNVEDNAHIYSVIPQDELEKYMQ